VALGDVNGDGRPDLLVANFDGNTASVLLNTTAAVALGTGTATGTIQDDDAPASVTPAGGDHQSAPVNSPFAAPLVAAVRNAAGHLVQGVSVTFSAPAAGPGGSFAGSPTALSDAGGLATAPPLVANGTSGNFQVTATAAGSPSAAFALSNVAALPPFVSVAFGPFGQVLEVVNPQGILTQYDAFGAHVLGGGVRTASVAFNPGGGEELLITFQSGLVELFDASGGHVLGGGVRSASLAFGPFGEVMEVVSLDGTLTQFDAGGGHVLGSGVSSANVAFGPAGLVLDVVTTAGALIQCDTSGTRVLGGGVQSAGVAFTPAGQEVLDVIFQSGALWQFDPFGAHPLGPVF